MEINLYQSRDRIPEKIIDLMKDEFSSIPIEKPYRENYAYDHSNKPQNLFYMLRNGKYDTGNYMVITEDAATERFVCSAGWYHYDSSIALVMTRMYVSPEFRHSFYTGKYILPKIFEQTSVYERLWMTVNKYNKAAVVYLSNPKKFGNVWPEGYNRFTNIGQREVNHTMQYVMEYIND